MIPNPNAPDEYKYETDYRKIPRQYLDANIPMPEQYQQLNDFIEEQNKIAMPSLSDDQFENINRQLTYKFTQHQLAMISYWRNGYIQSIAAYIRRIDSLNRCITISNENGSQTMKLDFEVICNVE